VATAAVNGAPTADQWHYGWSRPDLGMNVRWGAPRRFLDGIEQFAPSVAYLMAVDDAATSATGQDHPGLNILRAQRDIGAGSKVALV